MQNEKAQAELNAANAEIIELVKQYTSGLITILEFVNAISAFQDQVSNLNTYGLTDPNTGLVYPGHRNAWYVNRATMAAICGERGTMCLAQTYPVR